MNNASTKTYNLLQKLQAINWIDAKTRVVIVEFSVYNPNQNQFAFGQLLVEFPASGGVRPSMDFKIQRLRRYMSGGDYETLLLEILVSVLLVVFYFFFQEVPQMMQMKWLYLASNYNRLDLLIYMIFFSIMGIQVHCLILERSVNWLTTDEFINLSQIATELYWQTNLIAIMVYVAWLKLLEYFSVFKKVSRLVVMIDMMLRELVNFVVLLVVAIGAYASAEFIAWGYKSNRSFTLGFSFFYRIQDMFNGGDFTDSLSQNRILGAFFACGFALSISLLLLNLLIAIITSAYELAKNENGDSYWAARQYDMVVNHEEPVKVVHMIDSIVFWLYDLFSHVWNELANIMSSMTCCRKQKLKRRAIVDDSLVYL